MEMVVWSMLIGVTIGVTVGVVSAVKRNSIFDVVGMIGALFGVSMPIFWLALILIYALAVNSKILPPSGRLDATIFIDRRTGFILLDTLLSGNISYFFDAVWHGWTVIFLLSPRIFRPYAF